MEEQRVICKQYRSPFCESPLFMKVGLSKNIKDGLLPINGLRHPIQGNTTGWYIWAGEELSIADDFFEPVHVEHLKEICPTVLPYLALAPGWRFLLTDDYADVWYDEALLRIDQ